MQVFFHNKHDRSSRELLQTLPANVEVIDYFGNQTRVDELLQEYELTVSKLPCLIDLGKLEKKLPILSVEERLDKIEKLLGKVVL